MSFQVQFDFYHGPLDLLVVLVRQGEVDVLELMISEITRRYAEEHELGARVDLEEVGEFLLLSSTLMEVKSRQLLPTVEPSAPELEADETKQELVRHLMEYRRFREAASLLGERASQQQRRLARQSRDLAGPTSDPLKQPIRELELWDLVSAFSRLMRENIVPVTDTVQKDPTPLPVYMNRLEAVILAAGDGVTFRDLLGTTNTKPQIIGKFLAVLELIKSRRVWVELDSASDEIIFYPPRGEPPIPDESPMVMADSSAPPDVDEPPAELGEPAEEPDAEFDMDQESSITELLSRLAEPDEEDLRSVEPGEGWADYEPFEDDDFDEPS